MTFADQLLAQLAPLAAMLPPVRTLHLPPLEAADRKEGEFGAIELADGSLGLAYVRLDDTLHRLLGMPDAAGLDGMDALVLAGRYAGTDDAQRTLGFAAINAITRHLFDRVGYVPPDSADSIGNLAPGPGDRVGMIGYFRGLAERIVATGAQLDVVERKAELAGVQAGYTVTTDASVLRRCNKVLSTSTILLNDTLEAVLGECAGAARIAMIGPSAGCLPDALFARGVTLLGGTWIEDGPAFVRALRGGQAWGAQVRKCAITPADYPGWTALRRRLGL